MVGAKSAARTVTIIDIAREAGVSKSTVSLVLKMSPLVKDETRQRVTKAMDALGYERDHPDLIEAVRQFHNLILETDDQLQFQPCVSPVWDSFCSSWTWQIVRRRMYLP